ncbi:MAG: T9SS type A sorting domain-containing protein [Bacteroidales bacterium]|nr:T9SS type A sorting domain-containing protein [Bacteroidales bacterium]
MQGLELLRVYMEIIFLCMLARESLLALPEKCYAYGDGELFKSQDFGFNWEHTSTTHLGHLRSLTMLDGLLFGQSFLNGYKVFLSNDNGMNWEIEDGYRYQTVDDQGVLHALSGDSILTSYDFGVTWIQKFSLPEGTDASTICCSGEDLFVIDVYGSIYTIKTNNSLSTDPIKHQFNFTLYPNPCANEIHISNPSLIQVVTVNILDMNGRIMKSIKTNTLIADIKIPTADLTNGKYILQVQGNDKTYSSTFIKLN